MFFKNAPLLTEKKLGLLIDKWLKEMGPYVWVFSIGNLITGFILSN
jgi:hypothetical protein